MIAKIHGSMREENSSGVVRMQTRFDTTADDLWEALTTPARLVRWIGEIDGDLRVGGGFTATFTSSWSGTGVVEVCDPPRRLVTRMSDGNDQTVIEATLTPDGDGVHLVVEERGLPLGELPAYGAGWQVHLEDLQCHLTGQPARDWRPRWLELIDDYRAQH